MDEGCWHAWFDGLADALRGRQTPAQGRTLEGEAVGPAYGVRDCLDVPLWPCIGLDEDEDV